MPVKRCTTKFCNRPAKNRLCYRCEHERRKKNNPYGYWFAVARRNAKRRGVEWLVTFDYWVAFCDETGYLAIKGRLKNQATLDRRINELGYVDGNIRVMTASDNSSKGKKFPEWDYIRKRWIITEWVSSDDFSSDQPF